jgi:hypothetical protein
MNLISKSLAEFGSQAYYSSDKIIAEGKAT